jgi:hypothetical protein
MTGISYKEIVLFTSYQLAHSLANVCHNIFNFNAGLLRRTDYFSTLYDFL